MLILENINIRLGKGSQLERLVLQDLNLHCSAGEFIIVIGGNGTGKSTLLNVISGFLSPDAGKIILDGEDITATAQNVRSAKIAKVMQDPRIGTMEHMSILENMAFAYKRGQRRHLVSFSNQARITLFQEKLALLNMGLEHRLHELVSNLSGGQRQALSLIMAIVADAKLLLLDEITAALDPKIAEHVMQLANTIVREEQRTCIMITHNMAHAIKYGDRMLILKDRRFSKEFSFAEKQQLTPSQLVQEFEEV